MFFTRREKTGFDGSTNIRIGGEIPFFLEVIAGNGFGI
jgi:hypothetical protein